VNNERSRGNFVAEWHGFRVWPRVDSSPSAREFQVKQTCPFISAATGKESVCVKAGQTGFCTASSDSNGRQQDWLACPFRVLDPAFTLLQVVVRRLFKITDGEAVVLRPVSALGTGSVYQEVVGGLRAEHTRVFLFSQNKLGEEISVPGSPGSPQVGVDVSVVELLGVDAAGFHLGRHLFFELQTMDFHGSPVHAIARLREARDADPEGYHATLEVEPWRAGERVEGPNKASVFKRTIYQTILEIQMSRSDECAGFAIALPEAVWESWLAHLGLPQLQRDGDVWRLRAPAAEAADIVEPDRAWVFVFDIDRASPTSPQPLTVVKTIVTTSAALIHHMFEAAPQAALASGALAGYRRALEARVRKHWPRMPPLL
jgi:hypothetical protein